MDDNPSPEEIRKRRLAYFQASQANLPQDEIVERKRDPQAIINNKCSNNDQGIPSGVEQDEHITLQSSLSDLKFHTDMKNQIETKSSEEYWPVEKTDGLRMEGGQSGPVRVEGGHSDLGEGFVGEGSRPDNFSLLREELRTKAQCGDEDGYNSAVERLISLAKQEIAESEQQKNTCHSPSKAKYSQHSPRYLHHGETSIHKTNTSPRSRGSPKINYVSSKKDAISPTAVEYEDFFSKSSKFSRNSGSGLEVRESTEEHDSHHLFQKSVGNVDDLGLSTHRPESKPSKSIDRFVPEDIRQVLGEQKYKEFLEKSVKDLDQLSSDRSSSREEKQQKPEKPQVPTKPPHLSVESGSKVPKDSSTEKNTEKEKPKLNRPKYEPPKFYNQENEEEAENLSLPPSYRHGYESLHRNVVFSSDEIYHQAYLGQSPPVNRSYHPLQFSRDYSQGQHNPGIIYLGSNINRFLVIHVYLFFISYNC